MMKESRSNPERSSGPTLTERVRARVAAAGRTIGPTPDGQRPPANAEQRKAKSFDRVYCEMRTLYRGYRRRTKRPAVPELRQAVRAYKRGPNLTRLVAVASFLDDRSLLDW